MYPTPTNSLLSSLKAVDWAGIIDGTKKTIEVVNQALPLYYQVKPIISNAKNMLNIAKIINTPDSSENERVQNVKK